MEKSIDWEKAVRRLEQLMRLKSFPVAFKMLDKKEGLDAIPFIRRPQTKVTLCQLITRVRTFDCWYHEHDIRDAVGKPASDADLAGPDTRLALDEMAASMAFVVGKKGKAPEGSRVLLRLTGPVAREFRIAVDGRAALVEDFGGQEPTVTITVDGLQFTRLAGGRPMSGDRSDSIDIAGDDDTGARIVENLAYVI